MITFLTVKSPPWIINSGIILWNILLAYYKNKAHVSNYIRTHFIIHKDKLFIHKERNIMLLLTPNPFSPVQRALKLATVLGTTDPYKPISIRPTLSPSIAISK